MATYKRFEELPVWQAALDLGVKIYALTSKPSFRAQHSLRDQIERAAVSVSNNIAEGFERGTTSELLRFLYVARGSAGEVRSMLCLLEKLADSLQNSPIPGQRYLTENARRAERARKERDEFLEFLRKSLGPESGEKTE